ncbi:MAG: hypothetical protein GVY22_10100 [Gammaproteobacteria bacterium]|nr:hypothetical protein [Gammaproteobacteria bacterium]
MNAELAGEIVERAVLACRENGYQVSAVVVDRGGNPQAMLRDVFASRAAIAPRRPNAALTPATTTAANATGAEPGSFCAFGSAAVSEYTAIFDLSYILSQSLDD